VIQIVNQLSENEVEVIFVRQPELSTRVGSRDKHRVLDPHRQTIKDHLEMRVPLRRIRDIVNPQLARPISYTAYRYFVMQDPELLRLWRVHKHPQG
jgi:hypothetical protein